MCPLFLGLEAAIERCKLYMAAGADMLFIEAVNELNHYKVSSVVTMSKIRSYACL